MSFTKVLIANRGEIAVRLIRACERLNLQSVAVFSDADEHSLYVELADEAVHIGPPEARASYLDMDRLIEAARQTGAGAIHPGYGFLAENAEFARRCAKAGIVFVGPNPSAIACMGAKIESKRIAEDAGVACVPGYHGDDQSDACLQKEAKRIGTPLLIKASAGGGGRGMRRVDDLKQFAHALSLAREEARAAFGDPAVLLERYVTAPRHIEVQILADQHGNVRHLFERDCSVQRNYQKVIEEAPAPNLAPALRAQIHDAAVKLASAIRYDSAGTVEFVVDAERGEAYFLEMNTRLQVEHPVTEMVTGIDLAEWQLRIAAGEAISFRQEDVQCQGWAIEARVAAENPAEGYRPETGTITDYREPAMPNLRVDSGVRRNSMVTPFYDSLLAKVIAKGMDRDSAIRRLQRGLTQFHIGGVGTNIGFLRDVLKLDHFRAGTHLTDCLVRAYPDGWQIPALTDLERAHAALAVHLHREIPRSDSPWSRLGAWRIGERIGRPGTTFYYLRSQDGDTCRLQVLGRAGRYVIQRDKQVILEVDQAELSGQALAYRREGLRTRVAVTVQGDHAFLHEAPGTPCLAVLSPEAVLLQDNSRASDNRNAVFAPTPGLVSEVLTTAGQAVEAGQPVIVLEAMKMLQHLCAPVAGLVSQVHFKGGDAVNSGDCLVTIEPADAQQDS